MMSMVIKEWVCLAHGDFDGTEATCPRGCTGEGLIQRVFRTAPAIQTQGFRNMNQSFENLAREQGVSNMNNAGGDGMLKADYWTRKKLYDDAASLGYGLKSGQPIDTLFKPLSELGGRGGRDQAALLKDNNGRMYSPTAQGGVALNPPRAAHDGGRPYDGGQSGVPTGE